ncbi:thiol-disulfide oxidoreductase DCC family protein [Primorskyibacter sp. 2E233]
MTTDPKMTVIYNDTCPICSREVNSYARAAERRGRDIVFAGLSECDLAHFGLTEDMAARRFHVVKHGELVSGIPAFALLWDDLPHLRWLAQLVRLPGIRTAIAALYDHVAAPALYALHRRRQR